MNTPFTEIIRVQANERGEWLAVHVAETAPHTSNQLWKSLAELAPTNYNNYHSESINLPAKLRPWGPKQYFFYLVVVDRWVLGSLLPVGPLVDCLMVCLVWCAISFQKVTTVYIT